MKRLTCWLEELVARMNRWSERMREAKAISQMGDLAWGPLCPQCGKPRFYMAPPRARAFLNRMSLERHGFTFDDAPGNCQCRKTKTVAA